MILMSPRPGRQKGLKVPFDARTMQSCRIPTRELEVGTVSFEVSPRTITFRCDENPAN